MDSDPELRSLRCLELLDYAYVKSRVDQAKDEKDLKSLPKFLLKAVKRNMKESSRRSRERKK